MSFGLCFHSIKGQELVSTVEEAFACVTELANWNLGASDNSAGGNNGGQKVTKNQISRPGFFHHF